MYSKYMCILLYVKLIWCNMVFHTSTVNWEGNVSSVYVHFAIYVHLFAVMVFQRSIVNWSGD